MRDVQRRDVLQYALGLAAAIPLGGSLGALASSGEPWKRPGGPTSGPSGGGPKEVGWRSRIAAESEPGEPMLLTGAVFRSDGVTPAAGVTVFAYHTDREGTYVKKSGQPPRLRGWARTGAEGRYEFRSIRPAPYPERQIPAHIHLTLSAPDLSEWSLPSILFEGDPMVSEAELRQARAYGRWGWVRPMVRKDGVWHCTYDIRL